MRRKNDEYKKSDIEDKKDGRSPGRAGSKSTNRDQATPTKSPDRHKAPTVGQIRESPLHEPRVPLLEL